MGENNAQLQERQSFQPISPATASKKAISAPIVKRETVTPLPASSLSMREVDDLQGLSAPVRIEDPTNTRPRSYDPEKTSFGRHSYPTPYSHLRLTHANPEDDGDDDRPKEHAIWILVSILPVNQAFFD